MNIVLSTAELVVGLTVTAGTWLAVRALLRSREGARLRAERADAAPLVAPEAERSRATECRAAELLAHVVSTAGTPSAMPPSSAGAGPANKTKAEGALSRVVVTAPELPSASPGAALRGRLDEFLSRVVAVTPKTPTPTESKNSQTPVASPGLAYTASPPWPGQLSAAPRAGAARWLGPGEEVTIAGIRVTGGMLYVGKSLRARDGREENCLVDPDFPVAQTLRGDTGLHYWPSYASITPTGRRAFLLWLADSRRDPSVDIGLVFIFFYGLERRLFIDRALSEAPSLVAEVERLLGIYGGNGSFHGYAQAFLGAARFAAGDLAPPKPAPTGYHYELPLGTRVHIGRLLAAGQPIDATAALLWVLGSAETRLRTPGQRCFAELEQLWSVRFAERNPGGVKVRTPQRRIKVSYRASSGTFEVDVPGSNEGLPDIASVTAPLQGFRDLLESCVTELEPYSRLLGRRPEARDGLEAVMLLPAAIHGTAASGVLGAARTRLDALLGPTSMAPTTPRALAEALGVHVGQDAPSQQFVTRLSLMLDHLDVGLEPDRRYGGPSAGVDAKVVAFRAPGGAPVAAGHSAFDAARLALEIGVLAAAADGDVTPTELEALVAEARRAPRLEPHERLRLEAFVQSLAGEPPRIQAALKRAGALPAARRAAIAGAAVGAVLADGQATADEVRFLERLHRTLRLPPEAVHAALHQRAAERDEPMAVAAENLPADVPLPPVETPGRAPPKAPALRIDQGRLARIQAETSSVSALLADVFADAEATPTAAVPPKAAPEAPQAEPSPYQGLDDRHGRLLAFVAGRGGRVSLEVFEAEARKLRLLPAAATEVINDWGFANQEEAVLEEDGDEVIVPDHLLPSLAVN